METLPPDVNFTKKTCKKQQLCLDRARRELESLLQTLHKKGIRRQKALHFRQHKFLTPEYSNFDRQMHHIHKYKYSKIMGFKKYLPNKKSCTPRYRLCSGYFDREIPVVPVNNQITPDITRKKKISPPIDSKPIFDRILEEYYLRRSRYYQDILHFIRLHDALKLGLPSVAIY